MEKRGDEREHETQLGEMRARHTVGDESTTHNWRRRRSAMEEKRGAEDTRLWRRREGLRGGENRLSNNKGHGVANEIIKINKINEVATNGTTIININFLVSIRIDDQIKIKGWMKEKTNGEGTLEIT
uniref:Uncharacterized protein n=1 Tax=Vitis vinifera TaxID=29760 RepID=A5C2L6_VITVI|nr:hypothetical protein VITISV_031852 [Vitis vinifera]